MDRFQWLLADPIRPYLVSLKALYQYRNLARVTGWSHLLQHPVYGVHYKVVPSGPVNRVALPTVLDVITPRLRAQKSVAGSGKSRWPVLLVKGPKDGALGDGIYCHSPVSPRQYHERDCR